MTETQKILELLKALNQYNEQFVSCSYSTMGFYLLVLGWLITSKSARSFICQHKKLTVVASVFLLLMLVGYIFMSFRCLNESRSLYEQLTGFDGTDGPLFEHDRLTMIGVSIFCLFHALVCFLVLYMLRCIHQNPVLDESA